jgi:hypothetical protein
MPTISYFLATSHHPIDARHPLWNQPLPTSRRAGATAESAALEAPPLSYGRYFSAVSRFCSQTGWKNVLRAATDKLKQPLTVEDIEHLSIYLVKHGAFYHPARVEARVAGKRLALVVNVATARFGKQALIHETRALAHLNEHRPFGWLPVIYARTDETPPMFLGDWFEGFHEFHWTRLNGIAGLDMVVWDGSDEPCLLSAKQTAALYRKMTMILTACYDPVTTCQIFPWHHAAGDFVVRLEGDSLSVKLITVRNFAPLAQSFSGPADESELLEALLIFFLHLSVRMRLDRRDGVSEVVWAPDRCLAATIDGFFQGLDLTARLTGFPDGFPRFFEHYVRTRPSAGLHALADQILSAVYDPRGEEYRAIERHLDAHIEGVRRTLNA